MKRVAVFGSTGSIGTQTLSVCEMHPELFKVEGLVFFGSVQAGVEQIKRFDPTYVGVYNKKAADAVQSFFPGRKILSGDDVWSIAGLDSVDAVVNGVSGFSGIFPLVNALKAGKTVALANKESVVCAGEIVRSALKCGGGAILPVDSEQSAIFQCLSAGRSIDVKSLILTASGGPFRCFTKEQLQAVTPEMAMHHPTWSMGRKITIDSATMFNKGLEIMEAAFLFDMNIDRIRVLVHPQSIVHSMVEFADNSVIAQMGVPDMRLAIQYALTYPERMPSPAAQLDLNALGGLTFSEPNSDLFPAVELAYEAGRSGGTLPVAYNSANEVAVSRFINGELGFMQIADCVSDVMDKMPAYSIGSMSELLSADSEARRLASEFTPEVKRIFV